MLGQQITNRLREVISKYTDVFSEVLEVSSLFSVGNTATCSTSINHGLATGDYVTIKNASQVFDIVSLTRTGNSVEVVTTDKHGLLDPSRYVEDIRDELVVEIRNATPVEYNGVFQLLTVTDRNTFTFEIESTPTSPATVPGIFLQKDFSDYNGYKEVTVLTDNSFTYALEVAVQPLANQKELGGIQSTVANRIAWAGTPERASLYYNGDTARELQPWLFITLGDKTTYKNGVTTTDIDTSMNLNEDFYYEALQPFTVFVLFPAKQDLLAEYISDQVRDLELPILKSLASFTFGSPLVEGTLEPAIYLGNAADVYDVATYAHRFEFQCKGRIQLEDTIDIDPGRYLNEIQNTFEDVEDVEFNPNFDE